MPDLSVAIGSLKLKNPILASAGTVGYGFEFAQSAKLSELGGVITKTITANPRRGNPPPRLAVTPSGMLNAVGLQNVGLKVFLDEKLPTLQSLGTAIVVSLLGESAEELAAMVSAVDKQAAAAAIELNLSCPNIKHQAPGTRHQERNRFVSLVAHDAASVEQVVSAARRQTTKPLIAKLSPDVTDLAPIAQAAERAGADALSLGNTYVGMSFDVSTRKSRLGSPTGGLSGPAIRPLALYRLWYTAQTVRLPIIGAGGVVRSEDAVEFFLAGAAAVCVGTAHFADPRAAVKVVRGLEKYLKKHNIGSIGALRAAVSHAA